LFAVLLETCTLICTRCQRHLLHVHLFALVIRKRIASTVVDDETGMVLL